MNKKILEKYSYILCALLCLFLIFYGSKKRYENAQGFINTSEFIIQNTKFNDSQKKLFTEKFIPNIEPSAHASALVETDDSIMSLFFAGTGEGYRDVKIYQSFLKYSDSNNILESKWSEPKAILDIYKLSEMTGKFIKKLGNPIAFKDKNGRIHCFVVGVSLGGWATARIYQFYFNENLNELIFVRELYLNPFMNYSNLVRTPAIAMQNGGFMLPIYHEMAKKFSLVGFFDKDANLIFTKKMSDLHSIIQPSIVPLDSNSCLATFRVYKDRYEKMQFIQKCSNMGNNWESLKNSNLKNLGSSSVMINFKDGILLIHNDSEENPILQKLWKCRDSITFKQPISKQINCNVKTHKKILMS